MKTVQISTANTICYLDMYPEVKKKLLDEILPPVEAAKDDIPKNLDYETVMDLDYLHMVFYEALRIEPPAQFGTAATMTEDTTFNNGFKI